MKSAPFDYRRPESLEEALDLLAGHGDEANPLAAGQPLIPLLAMRLAQPGLLVDLERVPGLKGVRGARIGALTTQAALEREPALPGVVKAALPHIGHFQIRTRGTIGGSLCHADPASEWPALALLLDAVLHARSRRGPRTIAAADFCNILAAGAPGGVASRVAAGRALAGDLRISRESADDDGAAGINGWRK